MKKRKRHYISVYFSDALNNKREKRDITLSFNQDDNLYNFIRNLGSSEIKKIIRVDTYSELIDKAKEDDRSVSNYIKHRLKSYFNNAQKNSIS